MKKIIYGDSNFKKVRSEDYLYIDKTNFIELLETKGDTYVAFLRPRRFGKSLFLSTLWHYYDENRKDEFDILFKDTYIGKHPTKLKNSYRVLFLEFSGIEIESGLETTQRHFLSKIIHCCSIYLKNYNYDEKYVDELRELKDIQAVIERFFQTVRKDKIYLIIDEYDHFANALLAYNMKNFLDIIGKGGFVRSFYEVLKTETMTGTLQRIFITGVTPITLDSLSSGFNIIKNISNKVEFNEMAGFTEDEVLLSINETIAKKCDLNKQDILKQLKKLYNGYKFNIDAKNRLYNSTMVNFFLSEYNTIKCKFPKQLLDPNVASDYGIIMKLFNIGDKERNYKILNELITEKTIKGTIKDRFDLDKGFFEDDFITLIYSMGIVTVEKELLSGYTFSIPNYMMRILYLNYFAVEIEKRNNIPIQDGAIGIIRELALGDMQPFKTQLDKVIKVLGNRDFMKFDEKHFQSIALSLLSFGEFYYIQSEREFDNKFPDIVITGREPFENDIKHNYLFELKWVNKSTTIKQQKEKAIKEIKEYLELPNIKNMKDLYSYAIIGSKDGVEFLEVER